jgi:hypothetical protein
VTLLVASWREQYDADPHRSRAEPQAARAEVSSRLTKACVDSSVEIRLGPAFPGGTAVTEELESGHFRADDT